MTSQNITLSIFDPKYSVISSRDKLLAAYPEDSFLVVALSLDPEAESLDLPYRSVTPAVLLAIKYGADRTILDPNNYTVSAQTTYAIQSLRAGNESKNFQTSRNYFNIPDFGLDLDTIPEPTFISDGITLQAGMDQVTVNGPELYRISRNGIIGDIIRLAPGVRVIGLSGIAPEVLTYISYITSPRINPEDRIQLTEASRYFLIDELANPVVQSYLSCTGVNVQPVSDPLEIYSPSYDYGVTVSNSLLRARYPDSMLVATLELDPRATQIPVNPRITPEALNAVQALLNAPVDTDPNLVDASTYLGIPELANPYLSGLIGCMNS